MIALGHIHFRCDTSCASEVLQLTTTGDAAGFPFFIVIIFICLTYCTNQPQNQHTGSISLLRDICSLTVGSFTWFCNFLRLSFCRRIWWLTVYSFKQEQMTSVRKFTIVMGIFYFTISLEIFDLSAAAEVEFYKILGVLVNLCSYVLCKPLGFWLR